MWFFAFLFVFSTTWNWHAVWPYGQHSVKVGKTPQEVTSSPVSKWPVWEIMVMIKIKIMTKVWTTRNLAMLITIMVLVMLAMILLITERELSKYLVEGGIHLLYVGRLMLKWADIVKWDVIMCNGKSMSWFIFVTNITNYIRGDETVMWRNLVFL